MRKFKRLSSLFTLIMFVFNMVIAQPVLATENGSQMGTDDTSGQYEVPENQEELANAVAPVVDYDAYDNNFSNMSIPGVSKINGSASYNIPIACPPGRNGMQPNLNISYSSSGGNGLFGVGWNMSMGTIQRVTKHGLDYEKADFEAHGLFSGELVDRNIEWGAGYYGKKVEGGFNKFYNNAPKTDGWEVHTKDGHTYYFGTTAASRLVSTKGIFAWYLDKVEDNHGNTITVSYFKDGTNEQIYPEEVRYANEGSNNGINSITFERELRPDKIISCSSFFKVETHYRIKTVKTFHNNSLVYEYQLSYNNLSSSGRSLLEKAQTIGHDGTLSQYLPAKTFKYQHGGDGTFTETIQHLTFTKSGRWFLINANNDAFADLVVVSAQRKRILTYLSNQENGFQLSPVFMPNAPIGNRHSFRDLDKNGFLDYIGASGAAINHGDGKFITASGFGILPKDTVYVDFNGDGWPTATTSIGKRNYLDINGDGLADLIVDNTKSNKRIAISLGLGDGTFKGGSTIYVARDYPAMIPLGDFNGDGLTDVGYAPAGNKSNYLGIFKSNGDGTFSPYYANAQSKAKVDLTLAGDVNGDGLTDLVLRNPEHDHTHKVRISNGDGKADILKEIVNGTGGKVSITYTPSTKYTNQYLPSVMQTVSAMTVDDGLGDVQTTHYEYEGGLFDIKEREFRGFKKEKTIQADGTSVETTFHQDKYRQGRPVETVTWGKGTNPKEFNRTTFTWNEIPETQAWGHVKLSKKETVFEGNVNLKYTEDYSQYNAESGLLEKMTVQGTKEDGSLVEPVTMNWTYENIDTNGWRWQLKEEKSFGKVDAVTLNGLISKSQYHYYATTNADGTFGDLQYADSYYSDTGYYRSEYKYDRFGNLTHAIDPKKNVAVIEYDTLSNTFPIKITNAMGHTVQMTWNQQHGTESTITDANGHITSLFYDPLGRTVRSETPDGGETLVEYKDDVFPSWVRIRQKASGSEYIESLGYADGLGRSIQSVIKGEPDAAGMDRYVVSKTHYDHMGRPYFTTGPFYHSDQSFLNWTPVTYPLGMKYAYTEVTYDDLSRPIKVVSPDSDNLVVEALYSYNGFSLTTTDPDKNKKTAHANFMGQVLAVVDHDPVTGIDTTTRYEYSGAGQLIGIKNALWSTINDTRKTKTAITYDKLGRKIKISDPDMGEWSYGYDANSNMISQTDNKGQILAFQHDALNRLTKKVYPKGTLPTEAVTYKYDDTVNTPNSMGRLCVVDNILSKSTINAYDTMGRVTKFSKFIKGHGERTTELSYDILGRDKSMTYPALNAAHKLKVDYTYYPGTNFIDEVNSNQGVRFAKLSNYNPDGKIGRIDYGNSVYTTYQYDPYSFRLRSIDTLDPKGVHLQSKEYTYSAAGNIIAIDDIKNSINHSYEYDHLHRLRAEHSSINETFKPAKMEYDYDDANLNTPLHAPVNVKVSGINHKYTYDKNGNTRQSWDFKYPKNAVKRTIGEYTLENKPRKVAHGLDNPAVRFKYDGDGNRVVKQAKPSAPGAEIADVPLLAPQEWHYTYYYGEHYEVEEKGAHNAGNRYVFAGNVRIARWLNKGHIAFYHKDHLGSTTVTTDANGKQTETNGYLPFGANRDHTGVSHSNYRFTDQEKDPEIGLYNYDARMYDPYIGRFMTPDPFVQAPMNSQSLNRYSYCMNNPMNYVDPSGYRIQCPCKDGENIGCPNSNDIDDCHNFCSKNGGFDDSGKGDGDGMGSKGSNDSDSSNGGSGNSGSGNGSKNADSAKGNASGKRDPSDSLTVNRGPGRYLQAPPGFAESYINESVFTPIYSFYHYPGQRVDILAGAGYNIMVGAMAGPLLGFGAKVLGIGGGGSALAGMGGVIAKKATSQFPKTVKVAKGAIGKFKDSRYNFRIDTNKVATGEAGFHIHVFRASKEVAKLTGKGSYVKNHKGKTLLKPSELPKSVRNEINKLVKYVRKRL